MIIQQSSKHFIGRVLNGLALIGGQFSQASVGFGTGLFDHPKCAHDGDGLFFPTNWEIH